MNEKPPLKASHLSRLRNWLSLSGAVLVVAALFAFMLLFAVDLFAVHANPYMGILAYVVTPMFLFAGLGLVLLGYILETCQVRKALAGVQTPFILHVNLSRRRDRRLLTAFVIGSFGFIFLTALGSYQTYHLTETNSFCGATCHVPMEPQYNAYQHSAHAQVACVACHVGPGAGNYIRTKVSGVRQLYRTVLGNFDRPVRLHNVNQRPAEETCQSCHWSEKHIGNVHRKFKRFLADETNSPFTVQMVLKVGGSDPVHGVVEGIHSHMNVSNKIEFIALDPERQQIPWVRVTDADGKVTEYRSEDFKDDISKHPIRAMDCMDCHNRPAHKFLSPNAAVDQAMAMGRIAPSIPWAKAKVVEALVQPYSTRAEANEKIAAFLHAEYPDDPRVDALIKEVLVIYENNFYPEMKADWRAYPDHIGHKETNGCFRCHAGNLFNEDRGKTIKGSDCNACHLITAQGAGAELEKVNLKGHDFFHLDSEYLEPNCAECHNGQNME
ncbi:MAG: NapC/NirT family cytochrome c [Luteolibacter sp.]|jgi:nitrate/TMAO reductase-like tetraheme cytochrome c subunit|nr:NapC/NirT family cytochrome c [Luteolibacter sp.]